MPTQASTIHFTDLRPDLGDFLTDALEGLTASPKRIAPKYFYDQRGSELFDRITRLDEYYPTRTEIAILRDAASEIAHLAGDDCLLIEYGSGSSLKTRILLDALRGQRPAYVAIDISGDHLAASAQQLAAEYPEIDVYAVCADYSHPIALPEQALARAQKRLAFFPGSTIGNFTPAAAEQFLAASLETVGPDGSMLIGVDLAKSKQVLEAAYDDSEGVTAAFNRNLLARMNRELNADFAPEEFRHHAFYDQDKGRIEMHLESKESQTATLNGREIEFAKGERLHTENSYKYTLEDFQALADRAGYQTARTWTDDHKWFSVHWLDVMAALGQAR